jgi:thiamine biosynthesis lipoprotein
MPYEYPLDEGQSVTRYAMGSLLTIKVWDPNQNTSHAVSLAFSEVRRIERLLSVFNENSEISKINKTAGSLFVDLEALAVIQIALAIARQTTGAYDPTAASRTPDCIGYRQIDIDLTRGVLIKHQPGVQIDLGGIGKGYALDRAAVLLRSQGICKGLLTFGSTIVAIGPPPNEPPFRIAIRRPRKKEEMRETVSIRDEAISTSGDYEKYRIVKGKRIGHIIDPATGLSAQGVSSASVIGSTGIMTDALSTALFVMGPEKGIPFLSSLEKVQGILIETEEHGLSIHRTAPWKQPGRWDRGGEESGIDRRVFLKRVVAAFTGLIFSFFPKSVFAQQFLSEEEALRLLMPSLDRFELQQYTLTAEQLDQAQERVGRRFREKAIAVYKAFLQETLIGYGFILDVTGKERAITFMIGVDPEGKLLGLEVMVYRESHGFEIRSRQFMKQFLGKTLASALTLGEDIAAISGATLSSRAAAYAAKKALALHSVLFKKTAGTTGAADATGAK